MPLCIVVLSNLFHRCDTMPTKETVVTEIDDQQNRKMNEMCMELVWGTVTTTDIVHFLRKNVDAEKTTFSHNSSKSIYA